MTWTEHGGDTTPQHLDLTVGSATDGAKASCRLLDNGMQLVLVDVTTGEWCSDGDRTSAALRGIDKAVARLADLRVAVERG